MENKEYRFALLIDTDNVAPKYYDIIVDELEELGSLKIKRAYGDFHPGNPWKEKAISEGILPVQAFAQTKGKNSTDLVLTIDAMDIFYGEEVDAFCIATSDSDFARLAQRLKEGGKYIVIAGEDKTPISLSKSSDKFLMLDQLYTAQNSTKPEKNQEIGTEQKSENVQAPSLIKIRRAVKEIIAAGAEPDGRILYTTVVTQLAKKYPQFNHKTYGAQNKQEFFRSKIGCDFEQKGNIVWIRLKAGKK